ncbi:MAG: hypothetical protein H0W73_01380 [Bacteroidetes bacterium]|nr:hypothetical protein [Bacteroidota bacterium]
METSPIDIFDLLLSPFYIIAVFIIASYYQRLNYNVKKKAHYRYFLPALACKMVGGISLCLIYTYYYVDGGDVTNYYYTSCTFINVLLNGEFSKFFSLFSLSSMDEVREIIRSGQYGSVFFNLGDTYAFFTVSLTLPFCLLACKSFVATTILLSSFSFIGLWKLYEVFVAHFKELSKEFAIAIFFIPSVFFWGSGILKDTYSLSAVGFYTYGFYRLLILKERKLKYIALLLVSSLFILLIKPYIFFALAPGSLIWNYFYKIKSIKSPILRMLSLPIILFFAGSVVVVGLQFFGQYLGEYSLDNVLSKAVKTQQDLIRSQYGSNSYNIGEFDASIAGITSKIPAAINMALFRPYIWDARNPVMLISGLENLFMLGFSLYIVYKVKITTLIRSLFGHPLLIFSFLFALFFAFSVGLTTANYGALVRLKIPCIPFYMCSLFILYSINKASFKNK